MINLGTIGAVAVAIGGDTSGLKRALSESDAALAKTKDRMEAAKIVAIGLGAALAATGVAVLALTKKAIDYADETGKMAQRVGVATQTLSEYNYVAKLSGVSSEQMAGAMGRLNRNISDAAAGTGDAVRAFDALGINVKNADGSLKSADQIMEEVSDKFEGMEDGANKSALAMMLMGRSGASMIPMLNGGSRAIAAARAEARQFGNVVSDQAAKASEEFNDNMSRLGEVALGLGARVRDAVLPALTSLSTRMVESAKETDAFANAGKAADVGLRLLATAGTVIASVFSIAGKTIGGFAAMAMQLLTGDFKGALTTSNNVFRDWQNEVSDAVRSVEDTWTAAAKNVNDNPVGPGGKKSKGPNVKSTEQLNEEKKREADLLKQSTQGWIEHAEAVMAAAEEELVALAKIEDEKWKRIDEGMEKLKDSFKTEATLQQEKYDGELSALRLALENKAITQEEFDSIAEAAATRHEDRMNEITRKGLTQREKFEAMSAKDKAKTIFGELANITAGVSQHNKKLFELNKVAGIANAIVSAYEGVSKTLAMYPYPYNLVLAAAHAAAAFAQVSAIKSASFSGGGGGTAPGLAGSTPAPAVTPVGQGGTSGQVTNVFLPGTDFVSTQSVRAMLKEIAEETGSNGGRLNVR